MTLVPKIPLPPARPPAGPSTCGRLRLPSRGCRPEKALADPKARGERTLLTAPGPGQPSASTHPPAARTSPRPRARLSPTPRGRAGAQEALFLRLTTPLRGGGAGHPGKGQSGQGHGGRRTAGGRVLRHASRPLQPRAPGRPRPAASPAGAKAERSRAVGGSRRGARGRGHSPSELWPRSPAERSLLGAPAPPPSWSLFNDAPCAAFWERAPGRPIARRPGLARSRRSRRRRRRRRGVAGLGLRARDGVLPCPGPVPACLLARPPPAARPGAPPARTCPLRPRSIRGRAACGTRSACDPAERASSPLASPPHTHSPELRAPDGDEAGAPSAGSLASGVGGARRPRCAVWGPRSSDVRCGAWREGPLGDLGTHPSSPHCFSAHTSSNCWKPCSVLS